MDPPEHLHCPPRTSLQVFQGPDSLVISVVTLFLGAGTMLGYKVVADTFVADTFVSFFAFQPTARLFALQEWNLALRRVSVLVGDIFFDRVGNPLAGSRIEQRLSRIA
jgi:hypothetical protein